ncbi:MAG: histidine--tRNA ligase, partial [Ruminococcaceae bacterium]|nr:histidine--tRNA ligase [Oscillospiraceae bacterium]
VDDLSLTAAQADDILRFTAIRGTNDEVLAALDGYRGKNELFDEGLSELTTVAKYLGGFGVPQENFAVDLTIARGLDYYTGTVYETALLDHPEIGSVCSGGRYDNLAEYYTDRQLPGVGISIGLTRLFYVLGEQGMLNADAPTAPADALILPMTDDLTAAVALATALRVRGIRTQLYTEAKKFKAKMNYADKLGVPFVLFLGEDEISAGVVTCKDMKSGEQEKLTADDAAARIAAFVEAQRAAAPIVEK